MDNKTFPFDKSLKQDFYTDFLIDFRATLILFTWIFYGIRFEIWTIFWENYPFAFNIYLVKPDL